MRMFVNAIIVTLLLVSHTLAKDRDVNTVLETEIFPQNAPTKFLDTKEKEDAMELDVEDNIVQDDIEKRVPMGFQEMRGKTNDVVTSDLNEVFYNGEYEKRAPMGFQGMRGKKKVADDEYYKRAMMGFQGMRGKKSLEEIFEEMDKKNNFESPDTMSNKLYLNEYPEDFDKRAMSMGFQGMRGKKNGYDIIKEWETRPPITEFDDMGNRENFLEKLVNLEKSALRNYQETWKKRRNICLNDCTLDSFLYEKRAPMGFQGMRGKRNKNSESRGFIGMRGKRSENSVHFRNKQRASYGSFGMRGKKDPRWGLRGKFIGVRGKRWSPANLNNSDEPINHEFDNIERIGLKSDTTTNFGSQ